MTTTSAAAIEVRSATTAGGSGGWSASGSNAGSVAKPS